MTRISGSSLVLFSPTTSLLARAVLAVLVAGLGVCAGEDGDGRVMKIQRRIGDFGADGPARVTSGASLSTLQPLWAGITAAETRKVADQRIERNVTTVNETNSGFMPSFHLGPIGALSGPPIDLDKQQSGLFSVDSPQLANARNRSSSSPFNSVRTIKFENGQDRTKSTQEQNTLATFRPSQKIENFVKPANDVVKQNIKLSPTNGNPKSEKAFDFNERNNGASQHVVDQAIVGQQRNKPVGHYAFSDYPNNQQQYTSFEIKPARVQEINAYPPLHHEPAVLPIGNNYGQHQPNHIQSSAHVDEKIVRPEMVINVHPISYQATSLDTLEKPKTVIYVTSHEMPKTQQLAYDYYQPQVYDHQETPYILPEHVDYNQYEHQYPLLYEHHARSVSPWKKILHLVGTFLPLGLLFALLTPRVVNTSQTEPNIVLSKLRGNDLSAEHKHHQRPDSGAGDTPANDDATANYNFEDTCEETSICRLIATADSSGAKLLQQLLRHVVDRTTESAVRKQELDKIFDAAKMGNCDVLTCNFYDGT